MIIKGGSRKSASFFAKHLMKTEENERVSIAEMKGLYAEDLPEAFRELKALSKATRAENYFYHASINPREDERLTPEQWDFAVDRLEHNLRMEGHARFQVEHEKEGRTHRHIVWSRVNPETLTLANHWRNFEAHDKTRAELEEAFSHERTPPTPKERSQRKSREIADWENFRAAESGIDPKQVKAEVTSLWQRSDSGAAFIAALEQAGYTLCQGDKGYCLIDAAGDVHSLARRIDGVKTAEVKARLADTPLETLPSVAEASAAVKMQREQPDTLAGVSMPATIATEPTATKQLFPAARSFQYLPPTYPPAASAQAHAELAESLMRSSGAELPHSRHTWQDWAAHAWEALRDRAAGMGGKVKESASSFWQGLIKDPQHLPPEITHDEPEMER